MRAKHKLTELSIKQAIKKANSIAKTIKISDGGGMYLQVHRMIQHLKKFADFQLMD